MQTMTEKDQFLATFEREAGTTRKLLNAYPADRMTFKPAEKSSDAAKLVWTFVQEMRVMQSALNGAIDFARATAPGPATHAEILAVWEAETKATIAAVRGASDAQLARSVTMPVGPKQMGEIPTMALLWMFLMDAIHHRGQLSVYLRIVGATVPSIYGPTADEPWM